HSPHPPPRTLHPFPTRRSSDLLLATRPEQGHEPRRILFLGGAAVRGGLVRLQRRIGRGRQRRPHGPEHTRHVGGLPDQDAAGEGDRKSTRLNSSHVKISYAVFC